MRSMSAAHGVVAAGLCLFLAAADCRGHDWSQLVVTVLAGDGPALSGEMVSVPAGDFTMGSRDFPDAQPVHKVHLDAFLIDKCEVTNAAFQKFIDAGGYTTQAFWSAAGWSARVSGGWTQPAFWETDEHHAGMEWQDFPVAGVSWYEAEAYANFVGKRLPTEAEWEKAARGTDRRSYPWGDSLDGSRANHWLSGDPWEAEYTSFNGSTPVGFYDGRLHPDPPFQTRDSPSPYGAYDMAGNVWEWVKDRYQSKYYSVSPASNPQGPSSGSARVVRGGAWDTYSTKYLRSAYRHYNNSPASRDPVIGFRCAKTLP